MPPSVPINAEASIGISTTFLFTMEHGTAPWPTERKARFLAVLAEWTANPTPTPRKLRSDKGKRRRRPKKRWVRVTRRGTSCNFSRLDDAKVRDIRQSAETQQAMATRHGVSLTTVKNVLAGKTWKHVSKEAPVPVPHSHGEVTGIG